MRLTADTRPLRLPAYRRLWIAGTVTAVGGQLTIVAVPKQLYDLGGSSAYIGISGLVSFLALAASALWGGSLADVVDRRRLLLLTSSGIAITSVLLWAHAVLRVDSVALLLVLVAAQAAFVGAHLPALGAAVPRVVPPELIPAASSLSHLSRYTGWITGPLLAGALLPLIGLGWLYLLDAVALCAIVWAVLRLPPIPPGEAAARRPDLRHLLDGVRYLAGHRVLLAVLAADLGAMVFGMPVALFPEVARERFGDPPSGGIVLGLLYASYPAGVVAMGLLSATITRATRYGAMVTVAVLLWGLTVVGFGLSHQLWMALAFFAAGGAANFVLSTFRNAFTQTAAADELLGRTQGLVAVITMGGPTLGVFLHGTVGAALGTTWAVSGGGVLVVLTMLATVAAVPDFWRYRRASPATVGR
ncbi:MAG: putative multidrug resistance transporter, superfamily [Mycobacterium sp.]|jgi:hypothetical protein|nr:putative multidrug resistance transporter, superfamily [Mycobacterium sp.]